MSRESDVSTASERDRLLLDAFRQSNDSAAFESLIEIHRNSVFDLARRILGDGNSAEDVAQETFLTLYRDASKLSSDLLLRSWLLGVARHRALKHLRGKHRRVLREARSEMNRPEKTFERTPAATFESAELNEALESLPRGIQVPMALHYMHGLPHAEVAAVLNIPAGTVSSRIARGLERLRMLLEGKGRTVSAAAGIVALEAGLKTLPLAKAPGTIGALKTIQKLDATRMAGKAMRRGWRSAPDSGGRAIMTGIVVIALAGGTWWALQSTSPAAKTPIAPAVVASPQAEIKSESKDLLYARWTFEDGPPKDINVSQGEWKWRQAGENSPAAMVLSHGAKVEYTLVPLPTRIPKSPFVVTLTVEIDSNVVYELGASWAVAPGLRRCGGRITERQGGSSAIQRKCQVFFIDRFAISTISTVEGSTVWACEFEKSYPDHHIFIGGSNLAIESIELRGLRPDEIPQQFRDPQSLMEKLKESPQ
jgi:RNA polymerase sigma-70 factor (ECF subfamily)